MDERLAGRFDGGDLLSFESGPAHADSTRQLAAFDDTIPPDAFTLSFTRQFSFEDNEGEHLYLERLGLDTGSGAAPRSTSSGRTWARCSVALSRTSTAPVG